LQSPDKKYTSILMIAVKVRSLADHGSWYSAWIEL